jgi:hypothetical protein
MRLLLAAETTLSLSGAVTVPPPAAINAVRHESRNELPTEMREVKPAFPRRRIEGDGVRQLKHHRQKAAARRARSRLSFHEMGQFTPNETSPIVERNGLPWRGELNTYIR